MREFSRIKRLPPYVFNITNELKMAARRSGEDVIDLSMGNPDGPTPQHIVDKLVEAARRQDTHAYSVSKGGLMTLTKNAASLLNRDRIRVNQINVGWTLTEGERRVKRDQEGKGDEWIEAAVATRPFGRLLAPLDIAHAAAYFASDQSECVTGSVLDLEQYPPGALANS